VPAPRSSALHAGQPPAALAVNGKELDETGLYYYGARYYNPRAGVWMSPDPVLSSYMGGAINGGVLNPINLGLYSYAWNNPVILRDPNGAWPSLSDVGNFAAGVADRGLGLAIGVMQATVPGGFAVDMIPHAWEGETREFLEGKALGQAAVGAIETVGGALVAAAGTGGEVVTVGVATPIAVPVAVAGAAVAANGVGNVLMAKKTLDKAKGAPSRGGGKNAAHANADRRAAAAERYESQRNALDELKRTPNKTPELKQQIEKMQKAVDKAKRDMDFTGENHSQRAKGSR
jgi:RHS repeat-associated protein